MAPLFLIPRPGPLAAGGDFLVMLVVGIIWVVVQMANKRAQAAKPPPVPDTADDSEDSQTLGDLTDFLEKMKREMPKAEPSAPPPLPGPTVVIARQTKTRRIVVVPEPEPAAPALIPEPAPAVGPATAYDAQPAHPVPVPFADFTQRKALVQFILAREILGPPLAVRRPDPESR